MSDHNYDISIICTTSRPHLTPVLTQLISQQDCKQKAEFLIIQEHDYEVPKIAHNKFDIKYFRKAREGNAGSYAKDFGLTIASGEYVVFWDDDNWYFSNAAQALYESAKGHDIGIVKTEHHTPDYSITIPRTKCFLYPKYGDIDTMCFCVRRELAKLVKWSQYTVPGTDFKWLSEIVNIASTINYSHTCIGKHFNCKPMDQ